jgi:methylmalonyl-CoA mutase
MFLNPDGQEAPETPELARSTEEEKQSQLKRLRDFQARHGAQSGPMMERLKAVAAEGGNIFDVLMDAVRVCSLGQISNALFEAGGQYRRNV